MRHSSSVQFFHALRAVCVYVSNALDFTPGVVRVQGAGRRDVRCSWAALVYLFITPAQGAINGPVLASVGQGPMDHAADLLAIEVPRIVLED